MMKITPSVVIAGISVVVVVVYMRKRLRQLRAEAVVLTPTRRGQPAAVNGGQTGSYTDAASSVAAPGAWSGGFP